MRLLTLTGAAGSGKTRLALEVVGGSEGGGGGTMLVELARIADAGLVARTIADELGVKEGSGHSAREALLEYLRERRTLLLLDNFEHVLDGCSVLCASCWPARAASSCSSRAALRSACRRNGCTRLRRSSCRIGRSARRLPELR